MDGVRWLQQRLGNTVSTAGLLVALIAAVGAVGSLVLGDGWLVWAVVVAIGASAFGGASASSMLLRARDARPLTRANAAGLLSAVAELSRRAGLERAPRLMVLPTPRLEAFTTGRREDAVIAVSDGLLRRLPERELLGVLAHEVSHLAHRDLLVLGTARSLGRFGRFVSRLGLLVVVLSLPAMLWSGQGVSWLLVLALLLAPRFLLSIEQALSRSREFDADAGAAALTGDPEALARALVRVEADAQQRDPMWRLLGMRTVLPPWLQSHPATRERVARLAALRV